MSTQNPPVMVPSPMAAAGARWASRAAQRLLGFGRAAWRGLEIVGQRRAARELELIARRYAYSDPALARQLRAASRFDTLTHGANKT